jgi:peptidoglycan/LPS O-acetylase OafA/YrhL
LAERPEKPSGALPGSTRPADIHKTPDPRPHFVELDALRGIAVLGVAMAHLALNWAQTGLHLPVPLFRVDVLDFLQLFGFFQVPLFFMLSGYLLTWTEEERRKRRGGAYSVLNYAKRRALRLVPAYYVAIAVVVLLGPAAPTLKEVAVHMTFLHGFFTTRAIELGPFWTLTPEIAFYALLPLLVLKLRTFSQRVTIFGLLLLVSIITRLMMVDALGLRPALGVFGKHLATYPTTWLYLCVAGVLFRMMVERFADPDSASSTRRLSVASALTVIPLALLLVFTLLVFPYLGMKPLAIALSPVAMIVEALAILVFVSAVLGSPILKPVLRWGPLGFVGKISYSLYLLHGLVLFAVLTYVVMPVVALWVAKQGPLTMWATFVAYAFVGLGVSGALAYLSFRYVESPFMRIKPK